jgi:hypothetical protein
LDWEPRTLSRRPTQGCVYQRARVVSRAQASLLGLLLTCSRTSQQLDRQVSKPRLCGTPSNHLAWRRVWRKVFHVLWRKMAHRPLNKAPSQAQKRYKTRYLARPGRYRGNTRSCLASPCTLLPFTTAPPGTPNPPRRLLFSLPSQSSQQHQHPAPLAQPDIPPTRSCSPIHTLQFPHCRVSSSLRPVCSAVSPPRPAASSTLVDPLRHTTTRSIALWQHLLHPSLNFAICSSLASFYPSLPSLALRSA